METLLRFLKTQCAQLALPDMEAPPSCIFLETEKEKVRTDGQLYTIQTRIHQGLTDFGKAATDSDP